VPSASRGGRTHFHATALGVERAAHLPSDVMHGARAYTDFEGNFVDAFASPSPVIKKTAS